MLLAVILAVATKTLSFDGGHMSMSVPSSVQVRQQQVNFETGAYDLYEAGDTSPLLQITAGGGSYGDINKFDEFCLNGRAAWRKERGDSGLVVVGEPGFNAVSAAWLNLSGQHLDEAKAIIASIRIDWGQAC